MISDISTAVTSLLSRGNPIEPITNHYFSDGVCIREMIVPAGTLVLGAAHKTNHLTTLVKGVMQIRIGEESKMLKAPCTFEALDQSRKIGLAYTECVVHNIIPTTSRDIEEIERLFTTLHEDKYSLMLDRIGMKSTEVDKLSFDKSTYKPLNIHRIDNSRIHGKGLFSTEDIPAGRFVDVASHNSVRSELGRYVNHSDNPNLVYEVTESGMEAYSLTNISEGEEFTVNYEDNINKLRRVKCQQQ